MTAQKTLALHSFEDLSTHHLRRPEAGSETVGSEDGWVWATINAFLKSNQAV